MALDILIYLSVFLGLVSVLRVLFRLLSLLNRHCCRGKCQPANHLYRKYSNGRDSWAVVTGGSDGIGEQYCKDLARQGFNICVVARNLDKINQKLQDIRESCGRVIETKAVVADFAKMSTIEEYQKVADQMKDLDIALLLLNAGAIQFSFFKDLKPQEV